MSEASANEVPVEGSSEEWAQAAHEAAERGQVIYVTEHGHRLAAIVPPDLAAVLEELDPDERNELLEDFIDSVLAERSRAEIAAGGETIPAEQVWEELGLS